MKWINLALPVAAVTLVTCACSPTDKKAPPKSTHGAPVLTRVWQVPRTVAKLEHPTAENSPIAGNTVVAQDPEKSNGLVFIDGTTGRITGRVSGIPGAARANASTASDEHGRPLVAVTVTGSDPAKTVRRVYDTTGHLVWKSRIHVAQYAGGYVIEAKPSCGNKSRVVIHKPHGPVAGSWTSSSSDRNEPLDVKLVRSVRPGWLVATRDRSAGAKEIDLIDLTHPGKARETVLRPPSTAPQDGSNTVSASVAGQHVYVSWHLASGKPLLIARYDPPSTKPVWQGRTPAGQDSLVSTLLPYPDPGGPDIVVFNTADRFWFLRPDTGTVQGPRAGIRKNGYADHILGASGGRVYLDTANSTKIIDPDTGAAVRTINAHALGITTKGYLIGYASNTISAYRVEN